MLNKEAPTITNKGQGMSGDDEYTITHPAYGVISLSRPSGASCEMFGSDLRHNSRVTITINRAEENRSLNTSWIHGRKELIEIDMTEHQWAKFVSSAGMSPTPCTLRHVPEEGSRIVRVADIHNQSGAKAKASAEFAAKMNKFLDKGADLVEELSALVAAGKANKTQLLSLLSKANASYVRLGSDAAFAVECFAEEMENIVESGRSEIDAHITNLALRTGIEYLKLRDNNETVKLENKQ